MLRFNLTWMVVLPASLFVGLMIASAGTAIYPQLTGLATPFICPGTVDIRSRGASYRPGEYTVTREISCVAEDGKAREDITLKAVFASFVVYSLIAFVLLRVLVVPLLRRRFRDRLEGAGLRFAPRSGPGPDPGAPVDLDDILARVSDAVAQGRANVVVRNMRFGAPGPDAPGDAPGDPAVRLAELKALRDQGLITAADYEAKKAEILAGL